MATERVICAGFGGQGVMSMGQLLTYAGMLEEKEVSWLPSYGPEMRGGTANCSVTISDMPVGSPVITDDATCAIVMNLPSLDKFENDVVAGGTRTAVLAAGKPSANSACTEDDRLCERAAFCRSQCVVLRSGLDC